MSRLVYFDARFDSECQSCADDMFEGERIARSADGKYICEICAERQENSA